MNRKRGKMEVLELVCGNGDKAAGAEENKFCLFDVAIAGKPGEIVPPGYPVEKIISVEFTNSKSVDVWIGELKEVKKYINSNK
jgi:hypothetical protein